MMAAEKNQTTIRAHGKVRHLTVPAWIARQVSEGTVFEAELTEDGILYRAVAERVEQPIKNWPGRSDAARTRRRRKTTPDG
jgi:hypothetical protein